MQIGEAVLGEAMFFLYAMGEGVGLFMLYDMFRVLRRIIRHGNLLIGLEDILYWVLCTIAVFLLLYRGNDGMLRAYAFMGILMGMLTYYLLLSRYVVTLSVLLFGGIFHVVGSILHYILRPFIKIGRKITAFFKKQLKKLFKAIKIGLCKL